MGYGHLRQERTEDRQAEGATGVKCPLSQPRAFVYCAPWPPRPGTPTRPRKRKVTKVGVYLEERCPISAPFCETLDFVTFERVRCEYAFTRGRAR